MTKTCRNKLLKIIFVLGVLLIPQPGRAEPDTVSRLEQTALPKIHVPPIARRTLKNGMKLFLLKDDEVPVVRGYGYIRTGSIYEDPAKVGLAALTGRLLREGGTESLSPREFDERLAAMGAEITSEIGREYGLISFRCLKEDLPEVLRLLFEMVRRPRFDEEKFKLIQLQSLEALRRQNDNPMAIAMREFPKVVYGKDNIWSRTPTAESIQSLSREDVVEFYRRYYYPDRILFALAGDFTEDRVVSLVEEYGAGWPKAPEPLPKAAPLNKHWEDGVYFADKKTDQTTLLLGHFGDKRFNPDKFALLLLNEILGGDTMSSRLGKRIRSTLGLSYGIYSEFGLKSDYGIFYIFAQTKAVSTRQVLGEIRSILEEVVRGDTLTQEELNAVKQSLVNSLYSAYEPRFNFVKQEAEFAYFGYRPNYIQLFRKEIEKVTLAQVRRVAGKYLRPDALQVLIVGDPEKIGELPGAKPWSLESYD